MSNIPMECALHNIQLTARVLACLGIASVEVTYEGSGDSGGIEDIEYFDAEGDPVEPGNVGVTETLKTIGHDFESASWRYASRDTVVTALRDMVTTTTLTAIEAAGYPGWEIDQGSRGTFELRADGTANLEHDAYVDTTDSMTTEYTVATLADPAAGTTGDAIRLLENLKRLAAELTAAGATQATLTYSGSGDSGGIDELEVTQGEQPPEREISEVEMLVCHYEGPIGNRTEVESTTVMAFDDAMTVFWEAVLEDIARTGYDQAEGGSGELIVRADGTATSKHTDVYETTEQTCHRFGDWQDEPGPALAA